MSIFASPQKIQSIEDCFFYHTMEIPGVGVVPGLYDLRNSIHDHLGDINFEGKRVLEIGPASGFFTFHIESIEAEEIVAVELEENIIWDLVPRPNPLYANSLDQTKLAMKRLKNSFWFSWERLNSKAKVYYGSAYKLPEKLGRFDVSIISSVLLHNRDPITILENCA
jgi:hypothetical protein